MLQLTDQFDDGTVLTWQKYYQSGTGQQIINGPYTFVAVKVGSGWYQTGKYGAQGVHWPDMLAEINDGIPAKSIHRATVFQQVA